MTLLIVMEYTLEFLHLQHMLLRLLVISLSIGSYFSRGLFPEWSRKWRLRWLCLWS
jgi:hypothetical protein